MMTMASAASLVNMKVFCRLVVTLMLLQLSQVRKEMQRAAMSLRAASGISQAGKTGWRR